MHRGSIAGWWKTSGRCHPSGVLRTRLCLSPAPTTRRQIRGCGEVPTMQEGLPRAPGRITEIGWDWNTVTKVKGWLATRPGSESLRSPRLEPPPSRESHAETPYCRQGGR